MAISQYLASLRASVGNALLLTPGVLAIIRDHQGRILLHQRADNGAWVIPGGCSDPGEEPARTLVREVWEETGLIVRPRALVAVASGAQARYPNGDLLEMTVSVFNCTVISGALACQDGESLAFTWREAGAVTSANLTNSLPIDILSATGKGCWFRWDEDWLQVPAGDSPNLGTRASSRSRS